jgi:hypothetical protein
LETVALPVVALVVKVHLLAVMAALEAQVVIRMQGVVEGEDLRLAPTVFILGNRQLVVAVVAVVAALMRYTLGILGAQAIPAILALMAAETVYR